VTLDKFTKTLVLDGLPVRYLDVGNGPTLVLIHGYCESLGIFELLIRDLARKHRVVAIDLPGHGGSDLIPGCHNLDNLAEWTSLVLRKLQVDNFFLIGHSMGGYLASAFASQWPERLSGLCLLHSKAGPDTDFRKDQREKTIQFVELHGPKAFIRAFVRQLFHGENPDFAHRLLQIGSALSQDSILAYTEAMRDRRDYRRFIALLKVPVLYIAGKYDSILPLRDIRNEYISLDNVKSIILKNAGHMSMYETPGELLETLLNFSKHYVH